MSAALPLTVKHAIAVGHMSKGRVVKGIERCGVEPASLLGEMENSLLCGDSSLVCPCWG